MLPIPCALLPHTATLLRAAGDAWQAEILTPVALLSRVRVEENLAQAATGDNNQWAHTAKLWYDTRHSRPRGVTFAVGLRVLVNGTVYRIETVECFYDGCRVHHVEVGLSL